MVNTIPVLTTQRVKASTSMIFAQLPGITRMIKIKNVEPAAYDIYIYIYIFVETETPGNDHFLIIVV